MATSAGSEPRYPLGITIAGGLFVADTNLDATPLIIWAH
jgi:hypothetical protein